MFITPLIFLVNAFFISRLIKRIKISSDGILNFILGFFIFIVILYCFDILCYSLHAPVWGYGIAYIVVFGLLLGAYIFNWKYLIFKPKINWHKIVVFLVIAGLTIGIWFASYREIGSMFGQYWITTIKDITPDWGNIIEFDENIIVNLSVMNITNIFMANLFNVAKASSILYFSNICWTILAATILGCVGAWIVDETKSIKRISLIVLTLMILVVINLAFIETFAIPDAWLMIELTIYILVLLSKKNYGKLKLYSLCILLMAIIGTTSNAYFLAFALFIYTVYWAVRNHENSIAYIIFLGWAVINGIGGFISYNARYFLFIINAVYFIILVIRTIVHLRVETPFWEIKVARGISKHSAKIVYSFLGIFIAIILIANLWIFYEKYNFDFRKIDYRYFLTFIYRIIWNIRIDNDISIAIINSLLYAALVAIIVCFVVFRQKKNTKGYWITKDVPIKLVVVSAALFCNPLSIHVFNVATRDYSMNTSNLNMLLLVPLAIFAIQAIFNYKKYSMDKWNYYWI